MIPVSKKKSNKIKMELKRLNSEDYNNSKEQLISQSDESNKTIQPITPKILV